MSQVDGLGKIRVGQVEINTLGGWLGWRAGLPRNATWSSCSLHTVRKSDIMHPRFVEWENEIKKYCVEHSFDFEKAKKLSMGSNKTMLVLQYYNPEKGKRGLLDETPMPVVLWITKTETGFVFEQTEYTQEFLGI